MSTDPKSGFTIVELLVAIIISSVLVGVTVQTYTLFRRAVVQDESRSGLNQNGRVALDRMTRELRLTPQLLTVFPTGPADPLPQPNGIEFQDGYQATTDQEYLTYHRYYLNGSTLQLDIKRYVFSSQPTVRVDATSYDSYGNPPVAQIISTQSIALGVKSLVFYGYKPLQVLLTTADNFNQSYPLRSQITERNL